MILVATQKEPTHFIGSIVLYREKDRKNGVSYFTIVDGQQRIISLTIFLASIAFWLLLLCKKIEKTLILK